MRSTCSCTAKWWWLALAGVLVACGSSSPAEPEDPRPYAAAFDRFWADFDRNYSYFEYKHIDWSANRDALRERAAVVADDSALIDVLLEAVQPLRDVHVNFRRPNGAVKRSYVPPRAPNFYPTIWRRYLAQLSWRDVTPGWGWGRVGDVGYIEIASWNPNTVSSAALEGALEQLRDVRTLIIDVRANGGGNDAIALEFAARFTTGSVRFAAVRFRDGPAHDDFGPWTDRVLSPRGPWQFTKPVLLLVGPACFSSNETFIAALAALPHVTVAGDVTGGSSGNPRDFDLVVAGRDTGWKYGVPRWVEVLADGTMIEWNGITPDVSVPFDAAMVGENRDPVLEWAFERAGVGNAATPLRPGR